MRGKARHFFRRGALDRGVALEAERLQVGAAFERFGDEERQLLAGRRGDGGVDQHEAARLAKAERRREIGRRGAEARLGFQHEEPRLLDADIREADVEIRAQLHFGKGAGAVEDELPVFDRLVRDAEQRLALQHMEIRLVDPIENLRARELHALRFGERVELRGGHEVMRAAEIGEQLRGVDAVGFAAQDRRIVEPARRADARVFAGDRFLAETLRDVIERRDGGDVPGDLREVGGARLLDDLLRGFGPKEGLGDIGRAAAARGAPHPAS